MSEGYTLRSGDFTFDPGDIAQRACRAYSLDATAPILHLLRHADRVVGKECPASKRDTSGTLKP